MVAIMRAGGKIELVNRQILDYFGKTFEELKDWINNDNSIHHPDDYDRAVAGWVHVLEKGQPVDQDYRLRRADGVYRWFRTRVQPVRDAEGRVIRWCSLHTDIDDFKNAEEELRRSEAYLAEAQRLSLDRKSV